MGNNLKYQRVRSLLWKFGIELWWYDGVLPNLKVWGIRILPTKAQIARFDADEPFGDLDDAFLAATPSEETDHD